MASVTDTIFHLQPSNGVTVNRFWSVREVSARHLPEPLVVELAPRTSARAVLPLALASRMERPSALLAATLPASHQQSSAAALSTPLCFSPPSFPAPILSPLSLFLSALAMRSLSSSLLPPLRVFPLYTLSSFSFDSGMGFRTPYGSAGQLSLSDRCRPAAEVTLPACLLFSDKNNLADFRLSTHRRRK